MIWPFSAQLCSEFLTFICCRSMKHYDTSRFPLFGCLGEQKTYGMLTGVRPTNRLVWRTFWLPTFSVPGSSWAYVLLPSCQNCSEQKLKVTSLERVPQCSAGPCWVLVGVPYIFLFCRNQKETERRSISTAWTLFKSQRVKQTHKHSELNKSLKTDHAGFYY